MDLVQKLRYMGKQYAAGHEARGGGAQKHYLEEAADELERLRKRDEQWFKFAWNVGERVQCLASTFPDSNSHILHKLDTMATSEQDADELRALNRARLLGGA